MGLTPGGSTCGGPHRCPNGAHRPAQATKEGEGCPRSLFQARARLLPIISFCKASSTRQPPTEITDPQPFPTALIRDEAGPRPHHTALATPALSCSGERLPASLGAGGAGLGAARRTLPPPRVASRAREGNWSLPRRDLDGPPRLALPFLFRPLCFSRPSLQFLPLSLRLLFPPPPEPSLELMLVISIGNNRTHKI